MLVDTFESHEKSEGCLIEDPGFIDSFLDIKINPKREDKFESYSGADT